MIDPTTIRIISSFVGIALYCAGCLALCWWACTRDVPSPESDGLLPNDNMENHVAHGEALDVA